MSEEQNAQRLLQEAIAAGRVGDKAAARQLLEQAVALDPQNERAWYMLAQLAEAKADRIAALTRVVEINPGNERARAVLVKLGGRVPRSSGKASAAVAGAWDRFNRSIDRFEPEREFKPGIPRRLMIYAMIWLGVLLACNCFAITLVMGRNSRIASQRDATAAVFRATDQAIADNYATVTAVEAARQTEVAQAGPVATATPVVPTLPPTWTPVPSPTPLVEVTVTPLATAVGSGMFSGRLFVASGEDTLGAGYVPLEVLPLDGSPPNVFFHDRGGSPKMSPRTSLIIYTRYSSATRDQGLEFAWLDDSEPPRLLSQLLGGRLLQAQDDANFSPDGTFVAFSAREPGSANSDLYVLSIQDLEAAIAGEKDLSESLERITNGSVSSTAPDWGDSSRMVYVSDGRESGGSVDLKIISVLGQITDLTTDGNVLIENNPDISPDGTHVAYEAYSPVNPEDVDIYVMALSGGQPLLIVDTPASDVRPRWSPDGRYLVYSSNRDGDFEVYIVEIATYTHYQVTVNNVLDIANQWLP